METSLFDKYLRLCTVTAGILVSLSRLSAINHFPLVGASMLAMVVNDDDGNLIPPGALRCIAS
ncbi:hypothetical protein PSJE_24420 [Pseudomonas jessenii]|nr:hypothetical protein PSJE_24420 [Pseudomonas jessenii]